MLTRSLCLELAPDHIYVNGIAPGMVPTAMNQAAKDDPWVRTSRWRAFPGRVPPNPSRWRSWQPILPQKDPTTSPASPS